MNTKPQVLRRTFQKGQMIFHEGDKGDFAYLIQSGKISIIKHTINGMATLATVGNNAIFGEMALIDRRARMASAIAAEDTTCIFINRDQLDAKLATLSGPERMDFAKMMDFVRHTLPWEQRQKIAGQEQETEGDKVIRAHIAANANTKPKTEDRFLLSLHEILRTYVARRLPPAEAK